ncbi:uncharacterized protein [Parasteatoda tepidariorum]|uniref:uncharacterized protein n=1 Tax=Parasteatoda tepidariorum TaxID=114398 RepID=UPI00077FAFD5|nr:uncharacterized protein LOC107453082 [Parasteatoda tepidariorum]
MTFLNVLSASLVVLMTVPVSSGLYEDTAKIIRKPHNNLFLAIKPSTQIFPKRPLEVQSSNPAAADENTYRIPWGVEMLPRRQSRGRRMKKMQNAADHIPPKQSVKSSIPLDPDPTSPREPRGRDNNRYDVPLIECAPSDDGLERFACPTPDRMGRYRCIDDHMLCDGFIDCAAAEDEDRMSCMFYKTTKAHLDVLADALLRWARGRY